MIRRLEFGKAGASKGDRQWMQDAIFGAVCALVIGIFSWSAETGFIEWASPHAEDSYYNLLVQGFRAGQLNVKREAPPGLAQLADPYDPAVNESYVYKGRYPLFDMSYYKDKLYLYFGVTPALVLFWPYVTITGHYLPHKEAVVIFYALGFLVAAGLYRAVWRRYFPKVSFRIAMVGILTLGLATGTLNVLSRCDVYEVAMSCGYAFTMLALAAIWCALHGPKRQISWLLMASLAYGLAVGSRPSLLFGVIILLMPAAQAWRAATGPGSRRRVGLLVVAAAGPVMLIGLGLMLYNILRFDSPFEFGWHYQLAAGYRSNTAQLFSLHYLWFNFRFYFLEPMRWTGHFPFLQAAPLPPLPSGFCGAEGPCSGILSNYPLVWLALAAPLAWRGRPVEVVSVLRWFVLAVFWLFVICAFTICLIGYASSRYAVDFLPALMLLATMGILGLEQTLVGSPVWWRIARWGWGVLLAYTVVFNLLASVEAHATADYLVGNSFLNSGRVDEAITQYQKAVEIQPGNVMAHYSLGYALLKTRRLDEAMLQLQMALRIQPDLALAHCDLGDALLQKGRVSEAIAHWQRAIEIDPQYLEAQNNLAWVLATWPEASFRNGAQAVKYAERACELTHHGVTPMLGTLAAAYAEAGRFDDAIATAEKACALATKSGDQDLFKRNQKLLALYLKHLPYRESPEAFVPAVP